MATPKDFFLWTTVLLQVDAPTYARGRDLSDEEVCALVLRAAQSGRLRRFGVQQTEIRTETASGDGVERRANASPSKP